MADPTTVAGVVSSEGDIISNNGDFLVDYEEVDVNDSITGENIKGTYSVQYGTGSMGSSSDTPFTSTPCVVATANYNQSNPTEIHTRIVTLLENDANGFVAAIVNGDNNWKQCQFNFIAYGT